MAQRGTLQTHEVKHTDSNPRSLSTGSLLSGNFNPHLPQLSTTHFLSILYNHNDMDHIVAELGKAAEKAGASELYLAGPLGPRFIFFSNPQWIAKLYNLETLAIKQSSQDEKKDLNNKKNGIRNATGLFVNSDKWGVQQKAFTKVSIVGQDRGTPQHTQSRTAFLTHAFTSSAMQQILPKIHQIFDYYKFELSKGVIPDLKNFCARFAFSVMAYTLLGIAPDKIDEAKKSKVAAAVQQIVNDFTTITNHLFPYTPTLNLHLQEGTELVIEFIKKNETIVFKALQSFTSLITSIPEYKITKTKDLYRPEILGLVKLMLAGGFESTSKLLLQLLMLMGSKKPEHSAFCAKVFSEIQAYAKPPKDWNVEDLSQKDSLQHLHALIKELLRLGPPFPVLKQSAHKEFWLENIYIPKGTNIFISGIDAHMRDSKYGKDPNIFRPERWLEEKALADYSGESFPDKFDFHTFGHSRGCLGRLLAIREALIIAGRFFYEFTQLRANVENNGSITYVNDDPGAYHEQRGFMRETKPNLNFSLTLSPALEREHLNQNNNLNQNNKKLA